MGAKGKEVELQQGMPSGTRNAEPSAWRIGYVLLLGAIAVLGAALTFGAVWQADHDMRADLAAHVRRTAMGLNSDQVAALTSSDIALAASSFHRIQDYLERFRLYLGNCRSVYLASRRPDGTFRILAQSEAPDSAERSFPERLTKVIGEQRPEFFVSAQTKVWGPWSDAQGTWIDGIATYSNENNREAYLFGIRACAQNWNRNLRKATGPPLLLTLLLMLGISIVWARGGRRRRAGGASRFQFADEVALILAIGLPLTAYAARIVYLREFRTTRGFMALLAESEIAQKTSGLRTLSETRIVTLAGFFDASEDVTADEFSLFVRPLLGDRLVRSWGWAPAVPYSDRQKVESNADDPAGAGSPILEIDSEGALLPAAVREMYYPVLYIRASGEGRIPVGLDLASDPRWRAAIEQAIRLHLPTVSDPQNRPPEPDAPSCFGSLLVAPVFSMREPDRPAGILFADLNLDGLLYAPSQRRDLLFHLSAVASEGSVQPLCGRREGASRVTKAAPLSHTLAVAGQVFLLTAEAGPEIPGRARPGRIAGATALIGLLVMSCFFVFLPAREKRVRNLEQAVAARASALETMKDRHERLAEQSRTFLWETDPNGQYTYVSPVVQSVLGYRPDDLVGRKTLFDLHPEDGGEAFREQARDAFDRRKPFVNLIRPAQTRFGRGAWVSTCGMPIFQPDGVLRGYRGGDQDVTDWKLADEERERLLLEAETSRRILLSVLDDEQRGQEERQRLIAAMDQVAETVMITDISGTILYVNPAFEQVSGYSRDEALGKKPSILKSGRQDNAVYQAMWEALLAGKTWTGRLVNRRKNGSLYTEDEILSPVRDGQGRIIHFVGVKRDITEHLRLTERLQKAQKLESIGRLAGGVAHDLNNSLQVIGGYVEMAIEQLAPGSSLHTDLCEVRTSVERSAHLTRQLLAFARKQTASPRELNPNEVIENSLNRLRRLVGGHIHLSWRPHVGVWSIFMDPGQMEEVLSNLCVNARDAIGGIDEGRIDLATGNEVRAAGPGEDAPECVPGDYVLIRVSDNGCGMSREALERIFEPFFTTKDVGEGPGLGLPTVFGLVKQNKGEIGVNSEPGRGTVFEIFLPRYREPPSAPGPSGGGLASGS